VQREAYYNLYAGGLMTYSVDCPSGKLAVGGGGFTNSKIVQMTGALPHTDGKGWSAYWSNASSTSDATSKYLVYAICVDTPPNSFNYLYGTAVIVP
jgi:hypothetical protein